MTHPLFAGSWAAWLSLVAVPAVAAPPAAIPVERVAADFARAHQRVEVAPGRHLNLHCMGAGSPTVVFEPGLSDWSVTWALIQPAVATRTRACSYDRAGMGYSDPSARAPTPANIVGDLHMLLEAAAVGGPLVLVGHSLGGFTMKLYAATHPAQTAGLVLVDPSEERLWPRVSEALGPRFGARVVRAAAADDAVGIAQGLAHFKGCADEAKQGRLAEARYAQCTDPPRLPLGELLLAERKRLQSTPGYLETQSREFEHSMFAADEAADAHYARLFGTPRPFGDKPLIVLTHSQWEMTPPFGETGYASWLEAHRQTAALSSRGEQRMVPMSRHNIQIDQPQAVIDAIHDVLEPLQPPPPYETTALHSGILGEARRLAIYRPPGYARDVRSRYPVLYLPDGGEQEDFPHVAAAADRLIRDGTLRPFMIVGIENTVRRRDLTPPTQSLRDREITDRPGGAARFRRFLREELMPWVQARHRVDDEAVIMGESLAGLFVIDTLWHEPDLFDTYIALDPSLWWNDRAAIREAARLRDAKRPCARLLLASAGAEGNLPDVTALAAQLSGHAPPSLAWTHLPRPDTTHATIYRDSAGLMLEHAFGRNSATARVCGMAVEARAPAPVTAGEPAAPASAPAAGR